MISIVELGGDGLLQDKTILEVPWKKLKLFPRYRNEAKFNADTFFWRVTIIYSCTKALQSHELQRHQNDCRALTKT